MILLKLLGLLLLANCAIAFGSAHEQTVFPLDRPGVLELTSISPDQFTTFSHPAFPGRGARIKKSDFCDGGVASYTGYIDIGTRHLFFYFFESRNDPDSDDVLFWTNGGMLRNQCPGGSSAMGLFLELGPCTIDTGNKTKYNPYSWNTNANIFFIDQPVGVGFSYADFGETVSSTEEAAKDIAAFAAMFFETFSKFKGRNFHLTGESYAGRYLPVYAAEVYDQNEWLIEKGLTPVNLKSVMIGNGATDFFYLLRSYYDIQCTNASIEPFQTISACVRMRQALPRCERLTKAACVNHFDKMDCSAAWNFCAEELMMPYARLGRNPYDVTMKCDSNIDCYPSRDVEEYLNQPRIRDKLGVSKIVGNHTMINFDLNQAFWDNNDALYQNQLYVSELLEHGIKVLIYAGTYDWIANWVGNERWTLDMEWSGKSAFASKPLRDWLVDGKPAGKTRVHGNFTFASLYGAGHLVPHDKPVESLEMLQRWLADEDL